MCGRTVMVVVGRNIPVTLIDMEKVKQSFINSFVILNYQYHMFNFQDVYCVWCVFLSVSLGFVIFYPCDGPHHCKGICDGVFPHTHR